MVIFYLILIGFSARLFGLAVIDKYMREFTGEGIFANIAIKTIIVFMLPVIGTFFQARIHIKSLMYIYKIKKVDKIIREHNER